MPRVIRYEIAAADPGTLSTFYGGLFGWQFQKVGDQDYYVINAGAGPGIDGALTRRFEGGPGVINTIAVASVDEAVAKVTQLGGTVVMPKTAIRGSGYVAYCVDPENNLFAIMELNDQAK
jgi:predicted enzyme related to lactoylglutathione lyase